MRVEVIAHVTHYPLADLHTQSLSRVIASVLQKQTRHHHYDDVAQRHVRIGLVYEPPHGQADHSLHGATARQHGCLAEQRTQKRDQQNHGEAIEKRPQGSRQQARSEYEPVRAHIPEEPRVELHRVSPRGLSKATGRIISSGLMPPCKKLSR